MKATRVRASTSVKKEVLVGEYSSEWVVSDRTRFQYVKKLLEQKYEWTNQNLKVANLNYLEHLSTTFSNGLKYIVDVHTQIGR